MKRLAILLLVSMCLCGLTGCSNPFQKEEPVVEEVPVEATVYDPDFFAGATYAKGLTPGDDTKDKITVYYGDCYQIGVWPQNTFDYMYEYLPKGRYRVKEVCGSDCCIKFYRWDLDWNMTSTEYWQNANQLMNGNTIIFDFTNFTNYELIRFEEHDYHYINNGGQSYIVLEAIDDNVVPEGLMLSSTDIAPIEVAEVEEPIEEPEVQEPEVTEVADCITLNGNEYTITFTDAHWSEEEQTYVVWTTLEGSEMCPNPILHAGSVTVTSISSEQGASVSWGFENGILKTQTSENGDLDKVIQLGAISTQEYLKFTCNELNAQLTFTLE